MTKQLNVSNALPTASKLLKAKRWSLSATIFLLILLLMGCATGVGALLGMYVRKNSECVHWCERNAEQMSFDMYLVCVESCRGISQVFTKCIVQERLALEEEEAGPINPPSEDPLDDETPERPWDDLKRTL